MSFFPFPGLYVLLPLLCLGGVLAGYWIGGFRKEDPYRSLATLDTSNPPSADPSVPAPVPPAPESWALKNTDKLLIACLMVFSVLVTLVAIGKDPAQVQFFNGLTNTLSGCLITLVVGPVLRKTTETVTKDPSAGRTMGISTIKTEES